MSAQSTYSQNPLRPYYVPPAHDYLTGKLTTPTVSSNGPHLSNLPNSTSALKSATREILSDLDYSEYLDSPSAGDVLRGMVDTALMRYTSVLILQPFKVAKTVMQCQYVRRPVRGGRIFGEGEGEGEGGFEEFGGEWKGDADEDEEEPVNSDDEDPPYFTETDTENTTSEWGGSASGKPGRVAVKDKAARRGRVQSREPSRGRKMTDRLGNPIMGSTNEDKSSEWQIRTKKAGAVGEVIGGLWEKEGVWGVWKGSNSTFVYTVLTSTIEAWTQSLLSAFLALPDPTISDITDSPSPLTSILVAVAASAITAVVLAPLDIVRTRLILAPADDKPRQVVPLLKLLPSYFCPVDLLLPTALHAALPAFTALSTPWFLRTRWGIEQATSPAKYSIGTFMSSTAELFVRLPLETVLRRGQLSVNAPRRTVVDVGRWKGTFGTMYSVVQDEEGGGLQGVEGLYRGWRVGMWGLAGMWVMGLFGGGAGAQAAGVGASPF